MREIIEKLFQKTPPKKMKQTTCLFVSIQQQRLYVLNRHRVLADFIVSTAKNGAGEQKNSEKTPRGKHYIRALIGNNTPQGAVFVQRRWTGEIFSPTLWAQNPKRDWILSRILWLCGEEIGKNRLGNVDTFSRYIYIHGAPDHLPFGIALSHGCIRMKNADILKLFHNYAYFKMPVFISEQTLKEHLLTQQ